MNQNRTYQFITTMQEIKLQDCERRRRWEWEDAQADLFEVQMRSLSLQQTQEAEPYSPCNMSSDSSTRPWHKS